MQGIDLTPEREKALREYHAKVRAAKTGVLGCGFLIAVLVLVLLILNHGAILEILDALSDAAARTFPN